MQVLAELVHHLVAHPLCGLTLALRVSAEAAQRAAERFHAASAAKAWPDAPSTHPAS